MYSAQQLKHPVRAARARQFLGAACVCEWRFAEHRPPQSRASRSAFRSPARHTQKIRAKLRDKWWLVECTIAMLMFLCLSFSGLGFFFCWCGLSARRYAHGCAAEGQSLTHIGTPALSLVFRWFVCAPLCGSSAALRSCRGWTRIVRGGMARSPRLCRHLRCRSRWAARMARRLRGSPSQCRWTKSVRPRAARLCVLRGDADAY